MSQAQIRAIAFDLDGTLVDSVTELALAVNVMRQSLGLTAVADEVVAGWIGNGIETLVRRALPSDIDAATLAHGQRSFEQAYLANLGRSDSLFPGVSDTLHWLAERLPLAVVTNKKGCFTEPLLERLGLAPLFGVIVSGDTAGAIKPDPAPLLYAATALGIAPADWLMVGDSRNDIIAARAAGMGAVGLTYGYNYGEDIRLCAPDHCFDHFADLRTLVSSGPLTA